MSRIRRDLYRGRLNDLLSRADDEAFFILVWAVHAIQTGREDQAAHILSYPKEAATSDIASKFAVHPWRLETLLNELLQAAKLEILPNRANKRVDCSKFAAVAKAVTYLNELENAQDGIVLRRINVLQEMHRLAQRQFEWQRGFLSHGQFYRAGYIYGGEQAKAHFGRLNGITIEQFNQACFAMYALFANKPILRGGGGMEAIGISSAVLATAIRLISLRHEDARRMVKEFRSKGTHVGYLPSIFRMFPCISFGNAETRIHSPLPSLVILRGTSGIFYDMSKGDDNVKNEISRRFERYCMELFTHDVKERDSIESFAYKINGNKIDSPDIIVGSKGVISVICECKATRMSYAARFSEDPIADAKRGYEELAKGVFQIWRFASHCRRGLVGATRVAADASGLLLTLDSWLAMAEVMQREVLSIARTMAADRDRGISGEDQIPIVFCPIGDLEETLRISTEQTLFKTLRAAAEEEFRGWLLWTIHRQLFPETNCANTYPFAEKLPDVLPWWSMFRSSARVG